MTSTLGLDSSITRTLGAGSCVGAARTGVASGTGAGGFFEGGGGVRRGACAAFTEDEGSGEGSVALAVALAVPISGAATGTAAVWDGGADLAEAAAAPLSPCVVDWKK